jgi:DNA polymerase IV (archaeal DinB-like DNA polymerase)
MERIIGLLDLDYFYAQCEVVRNPSLKEKPIVIVMPSIRENSGVIATCNYEARALKIKSGMSLNLAKKLANSSTIFINADKSYYEEVSIKVFEVVDYFCEKVEQVSIDEAYFDLSSHFGYDKAQEVALKIKHRIKSELGLTCSIGIGPNKLIAKMASLIKKPDGLFVVYSNQVNSFLLKHKIGDLIGVGEKTEEEFKRHGVVNISDIHKFEKIDLISWFGETLGSKFYEYSFGIDSRVVESNREKQQLSRLMTIREDSNDFDVVVLNVDFLVDLLYKKILYFNKRFRTISLIIVTDKMDTITKSRTKSADISSVDELKEVSRDLLRSFLNESTIYVRRIGVRVSNFEENSGFQKKLFDY